ncbi:hypothetical protein [Alkalicoccus halolimnae]|uniref:Uncharacterized protein n=1 Tax=Alkalicoccus halolimnae TaxID=1667239 RepID=A0A5C7FJK3_9BACI|nr:hypothetical protein [Alkalicoccus halolimnae]TXF84686.1 hypothetical protein FTX54_10860 [Alkalicoccus halolimnae]
MNIKGAILILLIGNAFIFGISINNFLYWFLFGSMAGLCLEHVFSGGLKTRGAEGGVEKRAVLPQAFVQPMNQQKKSS